LPDGVGVAKNVLWPSQPPAIQPIQLECDHSFRRQNASLCHSCGELKRRRRGIEDLKHMNPVPQLRDFIKRAVVGKLSASKKNPPLHMADSADFRHVDLASDPLVAAL